MRKFVLFLITLVFSLTAFRGLAAGLPNDPQLLGFTADGSVPQRALERQFDAQLNARDQSRWDEQLSSRPNNLGAPHDQANAEWVLKQFQSWGYDAHIEIFHVLYATPRERSLEMFAPVKFTASLREPPLAEDRTSQEPSSSYLPPYNVYSADGDVTGELVYANYGTPEDYQVLARHGVSVKGKIVIVRYGHTYRGIKPVVAYQHGAIGCILYSDPKDDGYWQGDVYPKGPWRPSQGVQRGSVAKMQIYPGDPETPGYGSTAHAKRLTRAEAETLLKIPVLPISYADARPLLAALGGPVVPPDWRGALPLTYHIGPGPAKVHLKLAFHWKTVPVYDVIAMIRGSQYPDQWVIHGNHRDAWVFGAGDPLSGTVAMLDEARAIGRLVKSGWRPKRTIVYGSWDGEEPGIIGSTEWVETHLAELQKKAVLYVNTDDTGRGFVSAGGSQSLQSFFNQVGSSVKDPETGVNVIQRRLAQEAVRAFDGDSPQAAALARQISAAPDLPIRAEGSGSDFTAFLEHAGIAVLDLAYSGEGSIGGSYHSLYDSYDYYRRFGDPGFTYGVTLSETSGHAMLRMADAAVLPFRYTPFANAVADYAQQVQDLADMERAQARLRNTLLDEQAFRLAADPSETSVAPPRADPVPQLDFAPLRTAAAQLKSSAAAYDAAFAARMQSGLQLDAARAAQLNSLLQGMTQKLLDTRGLPERPWYQNMIFAPGLYAGYGVKTLPGVREAIEQRQWNTATRYISIIASTLDGYRTQLDRATQILKE